MKWFYLATMLSIGLLSWPIFHILDIYNFGWLAKTAMFIFLTFLICLAAVLGVRAPEHDD